MLTAILPIRIDKNGFWSSSRGLSCIETFLNTCKLISDINQFVVITQDDRVCRLAEQKGMEVSNAEIPGSIDRPNTYDQTRILANNFQNFCNNESDALIIADNRNLLLTADDIYRALKAYEHNPENAVISLGFCRDYPCQFRSYSTFLGCEIIRFDTPSQKNENSGRIHIDYPLEQICGAKSHAQIVFSLSTKGDHLCISLCRKKFPKKNYIARIIPFDTKGPLYEQSRETYIPSFEYKIELDIDTAKVTGIIFILTMPSLSGEFDSVEIFAPSNAPWELEGPGTTVVDMKTHEPMYGRQQFPLAYTYDGSLCILGARYLIEKATSDPKPIILENSCIVTDWVDYWYTASEQSSKGAS